MTLVEAQTARTSLLVRTVAMRPALASTWLHMDTSLASGRLDAQIASGVAGADAVLLIAECLDDCSLRSLHNHCIELGMTPLVELYDPANLPRVLDAGARLVGVNNRNLHTFEVDLQHVVRLRAQVPEDCVLVAESGIRTHDDVSMLAAAGIEAMLVGESLTREADIGAAVDRLLGA